MERWQRATVAPDETHHRLDDEPLYEARFLQVLKFHAPGLAPVLDESGAYHILEGGEAAYASRYVRTFGFYEGLAAADAGNGWLHILADGRALYAHRFAWCGNFQGGRCPVRGLDGHYYHLRTDGEPTYDERWRYAGDYRDGIAVVQAEGGLHTHIDADGRLLHGKWFYDLDVFHKGLARARDEGGWCHVNRDGRTVYPRRFAMVEPYYNGQARIETFEGALEVIDEDGCTIVELRAAERGRRNGRSDERADESKAIVEATLEGVTLPPGLIRTLTFLKPDQPSMLLIRHADREPFEEGEPGNHVSITPVGAMRARLLGDLLKAWAPLWTEVSPVRRCGQTAREILEGAAHSAEVAEHMLLGLPGAFVTDGDQAWQAYLEHGTESVVRGLLAGRVWPGMRELEAGARLLLEHLQARLKTRAGLGVMVSHDSIVMPFIGWCTSETFDTRWLAPLEGVLLQVDSIGRLFVTWDGERREVRS